MKSMVEMKSDMKFYFYERNIINYENLLLNKKLNNRHK